MGDATRLAEARWESHNDMKSLYAKKNFLKAGLYSSEYKKPNDQTTSPPPSKFTFSLPINYGQVYLSTPKDLEMPYDVIENYYILGRLSMTQFLTAVPNPKQYIKIHSSKPFYNC